MSGLAPLRDVVRVEEQHNPGYEKHWAVGGRLWLQLACGHVTSRKISAGRPKRARCRQCGWQVANEAAERAWREREKRT